ncbi:hypothetical protein AOZ06_07155 [Kibdelosporangium phytohabitans]|uniref:Uncharacterized protein n=2 Tax=Kibdelosporangium phytohabitans TaxID=860235 RepID=A0A0N7F2T6_9PSEU|nr:hypothetical protein AOZ06_07155 [Kibdelosporangium phytohabitans]
MGAGGEYAVALAGGPQRPAIVRWHRGQPTLFESPAVDQNLYGPPFDVSANGTVLATLLAWSGPSVHFPYVILPDGTLKALKDPDGGRWVAPVAINSRGDVVGSAACENARKLVLWRGPEYGPPEVLGEGDAIGIDDSGTILMRPGTRYEPDGTTTPLSTPVGATYVEVSSFDNGTAVGSAMIDGITRAVVWNTDGTVRHVLGEGIAHSATGRGTVLGSHLDAGKLWRDGQPAALPDPGPYGDTGFATEQDTLIATYEDGGNINTTEWSCS